MTEPVFVRFATAHGFLCLRKKKVCPPFLGLQNCKSNSTMIICGEAENVKRKIDEFYQIECTIVTDES